MIRLASLGSLGALLLLAGCTSVVPAPTEAQVVRAKKLDPDTSLAKLDAGRERFMAKCDRCHSLPEPTELREDEWPDELDMMGVKAKLKPEERQVIEVYLRSVERPEGK